MLATLLIATLFGIEAEPVVCFSADVQRLCCPAACAAKAGKDWTRADDILRGCMRGIGCGESTTSGATTFMRCGCK
jgi:hypothetical protein